LELEIAKSTGDVVYSINIACISSCPPIMPKLLREIREEMIEGVSPVVENHWMKIINMNT
jgi:hypothetical protein